jgi:hypothetical protein
MTYLQEFIQVAIWAPIKKKLTDEGLSFSLKTLVVNLNQTIPRQLAAGSGHSEMVYNM